jgi:hypothetical protein
VSCWLYNSLKATLILTCSNVKFNLIFLLKDRCAKFPSHENSFPKVELNLGNLYYTKMLHRWNLWSTSCGLWGHFQNLGLFSFWSAKYTFTRTFSFGNKLFLKHQTNSNLPRVVFICLMFQKKFVSKTECSRKCVFCRPEWKKTQILKMASKSTRGASQVSPM